jgi:prepilin-type N-terminal cleavage/methylation domain-containing protein
MTTPTSRRDGFTLVELMLAMVIMGIVVMSVPLSGNRMVTTVSTSKIRNEAGALADNWVARCRAEPNYAALDSSTTTSCKGTVTGMGNYNFTRATSVVGDATLSGVADSLNDYKRVTIVVTSDKLATPVSRTVTIAKP